MRDFLIQYGSVLVWIIAGINLAFCIALLRLYGKSKSPMLLCMGLIAAGLFYDAFIISLGSVYTGPALVYISQLRYVSHGGLIPLIFPICAYALGARKPVLTGVWVFTALVIAAGIAEGFASVLELEEIGGILRYVSSDRSPAWAEVISSILSYGTVVPLIICGIIAWIKQKTPYLFLSGFLMFAFSALGPATGNFDLIFLISMLGEICMTLFFYLYGRRACKIASKRAC